MTDAAPDPLPIELGDGAIVRRYSIDDLDAHLGGPSRPSARASGEWMPWVESTTSIDDPARVAREGDRRSGNARRHGACSSVSEFVGGIGLSWDPFRIAGEIGYWIRALVRGPRARHASSRESYTSLAFEHVGLHRVVIRAAVENARSRAVPERLGYSQEGLERGAGRGFGGFQDMVVYAMLADEWRAIVGCSDGQRRLGRHTRIAVPVHAERPRLPAATAARTTRGDRRARPAPRRRPRPRRARAVR